MNRVLKELLDRASQREASLGTWLIKLYVWLAQVTLDFVLSFKHLTHFVFVRRPDNVFESLVQAGGLIILMAFLGFGLFGYVEVLNGHSPLVFEVTIALWCVPTLLGSTFMRFTEVVWGTYDDEEEDMADGWG